MAGRAPTKSSKARAAILEALRSGREYSVRDLKGILRSKGIDLEATAQRIYELRRLAHGAHSIRHRMVTRGGRRAHVYYLDGASRSPRAAGRPHSLAGIDSAMEGWVRDRIAEGDWAAIKAAGQSTIDLARAVQAEETDKQAGPGVTARSHPHPRMADAPPARPPVSRRARVDAVDLSRSGLPTGDLD